MWYLIAFVALLFAGVLDGHISSFVALLLIYLLGFWSVSSRKRAAERIQGGKVFGIVFSVYVISALIASQSFLDGQHFYVSDSVKYIEKYSNVNTWSLSDALSVLKLQYLYFDDNNGLYNEGLTLWAYMANHYLDGTSVFFMTILQTLFGLLASLEIFKIFTLYFDSRKAARYTCVFAILSLFHIYSIVIIRDIVIAYFYMLGLRLILSKPRISDGFILLFVMIATMGIRLYTGLFFGAFVMIWAYRLIQDTKYANYKIIIVPLLIAGIVFIGASLASSMLVESTAGQIEEYDELYEGESGAASRLRNLPFGIRHLVILFFTQLPFDKFHRLYISTSFSNYYLSILAIIYKIFGFVVFYGLMYYCIFKGFFKKLFFHEKLVIAIMLIFIALNLSTHIDVRRSMEAIPFIYLFYMLCGETSNRMHWRKINRVLVVMGFLIMFVYAMI